MSKEIFLGEIDITPRLQPSKLNLLYAPVGAGKSSWVRDKLINSVDDKRQILYLTDTTAGRDQAISDDDNLTHYSNKWDRMMNGVMGWGSWSELPENQVPIMTFSKMAWLLKANPDFGTGFLKYIVLDEVQNLKIFQSYGKKKKGEESVLKLLEDWLRYLYDTTDIILTALSATPRKVELMFPLDRQNDVLTQIEKDSLRTLKNLELRNYASIYNVLASLPNGRGVIYTSHITQMKKYEEFIKQHNPNLNVEMIWSRNNEKHIMTDRQHEIWESILYQTKIPDQTDILLYNASCQTGVNIKTPIDFMIVDEWDADTITQARGRIRNDLPLLYLPSKNPDYFYLPSDLLGERIYQQDKKKIIEYINIRNDGHLKGWITVSKLINNSETYCFDINERTGQQYFRDYSGGKDRRYHIIRIND